MGEVIQLDLFVVRVLDPPWRDQRDVMCLPFLALQKRRTRPIEFTHGLTRQMARHLTSAS